MGSHPQSMRRRPSIPLFKKSFLDLIADTSYKVRQKEHTSRPNKDRPQLLKSWRTPDRVDSNDYRQYRQGAWVDSRSETVEVK
jgi:hypothetical protein